VARAGGALCVTAPQRLQLENRAEPVRMAVNHLLAAAEFAIHEGFERAAERCASVPLRAGCRTDSRRICIFGQRAAIARSPFRCDAWFSSKKTDEMNLWQGIIK